MGRLEKGIWASCLLFAATASLYAEEAVSQNQLNYTIQSGEDRSLIWGITFPDGNERELSGLEAERLYREQIFPRVLADAEAGEEPEVWQIGFFHLDGRGTEKDPVKAEAAFRRGMELGYPQGMLYLGEFIQEKGIREKTDQGKKESHFLRAENVFREVMAAGFHEAERSVVPLASAFLFGWYDLEKDPERADALLAELEKVAPDSPLCQFWRAKVFIKQKRYPKAYEYAEKAQNGFSKLPETEETVKEMKRARAVKISAAVFGGDISKIDSDEFLEISKESIGLTGKTAWFVPVVLLVILILLCHRTRKSWEGSGATGPRLRLSIMWISAAVLAAGIGFSIRLPGLDNGVGHWIGAILVTLGCILTLTLVGWSRYFGSGPLFTGIKPVFKALAIVVGGIVGMQLIAMGYGEIYKLVMGKPLDQQLVSLFLKSDNVFELLGTVLIVGIAIPFYEEVFFRGFLYDSLERRWSSKVALIVSSVVFALVHGLTFFVPLLFLSFILGWLRRKHGNLRMCFLLHAVNNSTSVLIGYFSSGS